VRLSKNLIAILFLLPAIASCPFENGFRFEGLYEAPPSGFRIHIVSRGYVEAGYDIADNAFARVQICPTVLGKGRPLRFSLSAAPRVAPVFESDDVQIASASWNEKLFRSVLLRADYGEPLAEELSGSYRVISNSLSGPKGVILEGQIDSGKVLRAKPEYGHAVMKNRPLTQWIAVSELASCDTVK
jgi:hypothetical protein